MQQRTPPKPDPKAVNHAVDIWREDHRVEEAVIPTVIDSPEDARDLGHVRLTLDLVFDEPVPPSEEAITEVISAVSRSLLDLHDGLWESESDPLGLRGHFVRYDGPLDTP